MQTIQKLVIVQVDQLKLNGNKDAYETMDGLLKNDLSMYLFKGDSVAFELLVVSLFELLELKWLISSDC